MEATRPVAPAEWSLKTEQRVTRDNPSLGTRARSPPIMHRVGIDNSVMYGRRSVYAVADSQRHDNSLVTDASHVTLFTESLILAQDERWRRA